jgi:hypothetical protein
MVRAAKLRLTVVVMIASFRWVDLWTAALDERRQRLWRISEDGAVTCPGDRFWQFPLLSRNASGDRSLVRNPREGPVVSC